MQYLLRFVKIVTSAFEKVLDASIWMGATFLGAVAVMIFIAVIMRYVFNKPVVFAEEYSGYLQAGIAFLGCAYALKAGVHVRTTLIHSRLPRLARKWVKYLGVILAAIWTIVIFWGGVLLFGDYWNLQTTANTVSQTLLWIPFTLLVIGSIIMVLEILLVETTKRDLDYHEYTG